MKHKATIKFYSNIKPFMDKFLVNGLNPFSFQKFFLKDRKFGYYPENRKITQDDLYKHFYSGGSKTKDYILGSMAIIPVVGNELKFVCFDIDYKHLKDAWLEKMPRELEKYGLSYIIGHGSSEKLTDPVDFNKLDKAHIYIPMHCSIETARHIIIQMGEDTGLNFTEPSDKDTYFGEIFGVNKVSNLIRIDCGYHYSKSSNSWGYYPIELEDGSLSTNPEDFIRLFLQAKQPKEEDLKPFLRELQSIQKKEVKKKSSPRRNNSSTSPGIWNSRCISLISLKT